MQYNQFLMLGKVIEKNLADGCLRATLIAPVGEDSYQVRFSIPEGSKLGLDGKVLAEAVGKAADFILGNMMDGLGHFFFKTVKLQKKAAKENYQPVILLTFMCKVREKVVR